MYSDKVTSTYASIQRTKRLSGLKILTRLIDPEYLKNINVLIAILIILSWVKKCYCAFIWYCKAKYLP